MGRWLRLGLATALLIGVWCALVVAGARVGWGRPPPAAKNDSVGFLRWAESRYAARSKGNFAMVLIHHDKLAGATFASHGRPVFLDSLFQVASMSKWFTAWGVMRLAEKHQIDLDAPVSRYLRRWRLPPSAFNTDEVTPRRLMSHTAGLTDGLGFLGFRSGQPLPAIEAELTHTLDAQPGSDGRIRVGARPGADWRYSGGGYLILQLMIEDVTHEPFDAYMRREVLLPLGMTSSTFSDPDRELLADNFNTEGARIGYARFTASGAASLFSSASDLTRFLQAQSPGANGEPAGRGVLRPATLEAMRKPAGFLLGFPVWGLGQILYAPDGSGGCVIGHDGSNAPAINTTARFDPATGDGVVVLESGDATLASEIGGEWVYWRTGVVGFDTLALFEMRRLAVLFALGAGVILLAAALFAVRSRPT